MMFFITVPFCDFVILFIIYTFEGSFPKMLPFSNSLSPRLKRLDFIPSIFFKCICFSTSNCLPTRFVFVPNVLFHFAISKSVLFPVFYIRSYWNNYLITLFRSGICLKRPRQSSCSSEVFFFTYTLCLNLQLYSL